MQRHITLTKYLLRTYLLSTEAYVNAYVPTIYFSTSRLFVHTPYSKAWGEIQKLQGSDIVFSIENIYQVAFKVSRYTFMNVLLSTFIQIVKEDGYEQI